MLMQNVASGPALEISLEFFPAKTARGAAKLPRVATELAATGPAFFSVTYGAGGTTQTGTLETIQAVRQAAGWEGAAHLTAVAQSKATVDAVARDYLAAGVSRIVALRGDPQNGDTSYRPHPEGYANAADLVQGLRRIHDFDISVAAYPEVHPDSRDSAADLDNLKAKFDAGANRAITQFFFDADAYLRFRDAAAARGIWQPILPGILPIRDLEQLHRFAAGCGATIPDFVVQRIEAAGQERKDRQRVAVDLAAELCARLARHGVPGFHFYTLNQSDMVTEVCRRLDLARAGDRVALSATEASART